MVVLRAVAVTASLVAVAVLGSSCAERNTDLGAAGETNSLPLFECDPSQVPAELPLRRLSQAQYTNTITDLVRSLPLAAADRADVLQAIDAPLRRFPPDRIVAPLGEAHGGFHRMDQAIQQTHVDVAYEVAMELGRALTASATRVEALLGTCATDASTANDAACLRGFIESFGYRALRKRPSAEDLQFYEAVAGTTPVDPASIADVIAVLTSSPYLLNHVEEGDVTATGPVKLDAFALASRLSYHFWQTLPDQALLDAAASGALDTEEGYRAQVSRLFADPRSNASIGEFVGEWLRLEELGPMDTRVGNPLFDAFAGEDVPSPTLHEEMKAEVRDLAAYTVRTGGALTELITSRKHFARGAQLAKLYGQAPWDGVSAPQEFTDPERTGLITRAAFLATGSANTRPIMKGVRIRTALMCNPIGAPPDNAMAMPIEPSPDYTTREVVEALTEQAGTACAACHLARINPLGYVTENFDALGRRRTAQALFNEDGSLRGHKPVNTTGTALIRDELVPLSGALDLTGHLATGGEFQTCFARQYFRFTFQRGDDSTRDGCALRELQEAALSGASLSELLMRVALRPEFRRRDFR